MNNELTADEVRTLHFNKLGPKLGPVYHELQNALGWLQVTWREYRELFGTSPERVNLANSAAALFFRLVHDALWKDILLSLCRLTDDPKSGEIATLTIKALPKLCNDQKLRDKISELVDQAVTATQFARDWRNRKIAHQNLQLALVQGAKPLAEASRAKVEQALSAIHMVLNHIHEVLLGSTLGKEVITPGTGSETMLRVVRDGLEAKKARLERLRNGNLQSGDLGPRPV